MNWRLTPESLSYKEAVKATESIEEPSVGFAKPSEFTKGATVVSIKQNNTIIQLLVRVSEKLDDYAEELHQLRLQIRDKGKTPIEDKDSLEIALEDIRKNLVGLSIEKSVEKKAKEKGPFYVFKDPLKIFKEEKKIL